MMPPAVAVGQATYSVKVGKRIESDKLGECNNRHQRIYIATNQSPASLRDTMLHEALHAIWYESSANAMLGLDDDAEERTVRMLTPWLLMLLRDNPDLVAFLAGP